jgi:anti-anti-sigma factor
MTQAPLATSTLHTEAGATIALAGDIDGSARDALDTAYTALQGDEPLLLDFTDVGYINSTGIALIVGLLARARAQSRPVSARGLTPHYREIFEITRLSDFMTILADGPVPAADSNGGTR